MVGTLSATVIIDGNDLSEYFVSGTRRASLCEAGATLELLMSPAMDMTSINPYSTLTYSEQGQLVLTGYVETIGKERAKPDTIVLGRDTFKRAIDAFVDDPLLNSNFGSILLPSYRTVAWWLDYLCNYCGLAYVIVPIDGGETQVGGDIPMGLRTVAENLKQICAFVGWQMRVNPAGVLEFLDLSAFADIVRNDMSQYGHSSDAALFNYFGDLPDAIPDDETLVRWFEFNTKAMRGERTTSDETTRTTIKIWGFDPATGSGLLYQATRVVPGQIVDRAGVFAHPGIDTYAEAEELADAALDQFAFLEQKCGIETLGDPRIRVGDYGRVVAFQNMESGVYNELISEITVTLNEQGYACQVLMGERCPSLPDFPILNLPLPCDCESGTGIALWENEANHSNGLGASYGDIATHVAISGNKVILSGLVADLRTYTGYWDIDKNESLGPPGDPSRLDWVFVPHDLVGLVSENPTVDYIHYALDTYRVLDGSLLWTTLLGCIDAPVSEIWLDAGFLTAVNRKPFSECNYAETLNNLAWGFIAEATTTLLSMIANPGVVVTAAVRLERWPESTAASVPGMFFRILYEIVGWSTTSGAKLWTQTIINTDRTQGGVNQTDLNLATDGNFFYLMYIDGPTNKYHIRKMAGMTGGSVWDIEVNTTSWTTTQIRVVAVFGDALYCAGFVINGPSTERTLIQKRSKASGAVVWTDTGGSTGTEQGIGLGVQADAFGVYVMVGTGSTSRLRHLDHSGSEIWNILPQTPDGGGAPMTQDNQLTMYGDCLYYIREGGTNARRVIKRSKIDGSLLDIYDISDFPAEALVAGTCGLFVVGGSNGPFEDGTFRIRALDR